AKVVHTDLELNIDFNETVIHGKAVLFIESKVDCDRIVNTYGFQEDKISVEDYFTGNALVYKINKDVDNIGSNTFLIMLPRTLRNDERVHVYNNTVNKIHFLYNYRIRIEYKTRKDSLALYWLRSDQTSDGTHPFLLTNNQFTNARGIFPCQDSPEVRFTYTAMVRNYVDIICIDFAHARMQNINKNHWIHVCVLFRTKRMNHLLEINV
ncbi:Leukotriene A-4 hydrolase, partial [Cyphomyrmex costatus]